MIIPRKCAFCNKFVFWWNKKEWFEITPDWVAPVHRKCYTKKNAFTYHKKWFEDIEEEIQTEEVSNK